ncbi:hypothetical protein KP509_05G039200 [Ceratopteris richardii]|uniref:Methyltransferase type 11 domain-containing protein n=1 Tax=Ceratopteris richardii TaxID=49495 RepID=A0A8T2UXS4_CERRI|nr:hypothetical protein KP509_05G039200 [Ceratopteris richardii]
MAGLFDEQASLYAAARPDYPPELFSFLASLTPHHSRAWDVGTGSGQAAAMVAEHYDTVIATDTSDAQLRHARVKDNIHYVCTSPTLNSEDLIKIVGDEGSIDLVTVAQALHWFDLESFYANVKKVLRKPGGILAAWCYTEPSVCNEVDDLFWDFYRESGPYWEPARKTVDDEYRSLPFPFEPILGLDGTGPFRFDSKKEMTAETFLTYLGSMSVLRCARKQGVELLHDERKSAIRRAWGDGVRTVTYPIHLRVGCSL